MQGVQKKITNRVFQSLRFRLTPGHQEPWGSAAERRRRKADQTKESDFIHTLGLPSHILTGAGAGDYLLLDTYIRKRKPERVLELGGGVTTHVMAKAMNEIGHGHLVSVEHIKKYAEATKTLLSPEMCKRVDFIRTSIVGDRYNERNVLRYDDIPPDHYDMMFCDFTGAIGGFYGRYFPVVDPLLLLSDQPTDIITDRKLYSLNHYAKWLSCDVFYDPVLRLGVIPAATKIHILVSNKRLKVGDAYELLGLV
jgi:predicted O-methyltransferase YrrM